MNTAVSSSNSTMDAERSKPMKRLIVATSIGNALEWFDFAAYGFFAVTISKLFFPANNPTVSLMLTFGTFGVSYIFRPLGALLLGRYADRHGRKAGLLLSLALTMFGTLICATIPTYESIGIAAPIGLMAARIIISFSTGGEFGSGTALMFEQKSGRKSFLASWQFSSQGMSTVLASCAGLLLSTLLTEGQIEAWGWRMPFIFGLLVGPVGLYIRKYIDDTLPVSKAGAKQAQHSTSSPVLTLLGTCKLRILLAAGIMAVSTAASYLMILYMPTYAVKQLHLPASTGFAATVTTGVILMILTPFMGAAADKYGRTKLMAVSAFTTLVTIYPCFAWLGSSPKLSVLITIMILTGTLKAVYFGPLAALLSSLFPASIRSTGLGFSYNIGVLVFGGFTPWFVTLLIDRTGNPLSPAYYLVGCALLSLTCIALLHKRVKVYQ